MPKHKRIIHIIGLNSFKFEDLALDIKDLFIQINDIAVPETFCHEIKRWISDKYIENKKIFPSKSNIDLINWLKNTNNDVILISRGDPLWYGIGRILLKHFPQKELSFYPSQTCVQLAFSKLKIPWQNTRTVSIHGRESIELVKSLKLKAKSIAILTNPKNNSLEIIRKNLRQLNLENIYEFWLLEEIGLKKEKISLILNKDKLPKEISDLNLVILLKKELIDQESLLPLFGINDNNFKTFDDRPNLITKRDIRIQLLADLQLPKLGTLFDIGSGTGTIGLEALRIRPKLDLICIDKRLGSQILVEENARRLKVSPHKIFEGDVNQYLRNDILKEYISNSNRIIIGGCDLETKILIIKTLTKFLNQNDIIVIPIIAYEVLQNVTSCLKQFNYETSINLIQTFKGISISEGTRFEPNNPVFIVKAKKK
tara:strand:- start:108 stop:1388 length:1281 start_codon:yes stop_codon:yes gene_type:complete